ncbi:MAG: NHL repeat-containing protein [Betaproteobacteria bacterium]
MNFTKNPHFPIDLTSVAAAPQISRRALLALGSLMAVNLPGCGGSDNVVAGGGAHVNGGVVTTLAGTTASGSVDGTGSAASFYFVIGVAVDTTGNVYVSDSGNNKIRKITSAGVVTTLAGSGTAGYADGTGAVAQFRYPTSIGVDPSGNVYVGDSENQRIRKVTPDGVVTTLAGGSSTPGYTDATGLDARFNYPNGLTVDASGNVYVSDTANNLIRKVTPAGVVTTVAGATTAGYVDATGTAARFNNPNGIAVDASGNLYVADRYNNRIRKITPAGVVTTVAGGALSTYVDGTGTAAGFNDPAGVTVDASGTLYVADKGNNMIRQISSAGVVTTLAGALSSGSVDGTGTAARFRAPFGLAVDSTGTVYVADTWNNMIRKIV